MAEILNEAASDNLGGLSFDTPMNKRNALFRPPPVGTLRDRYDHTGEVNC